MTGLRKLTTSGVLCVTLGLFSSGCWSYTAMDLEPVPVTSTASVGAGQKMLIAISPTIVYDAFDSASVSGCLADGGTFESMLCDSFVQKLSAAGFAGEATCQIGPAPADWQGQYAYLYEEDLNLLMEYNFGTLVAVALLSLTTTLHKSFDVAITSTGRLTPAGGTPVEIRHENSHGFYAGAVGWTIGNVVWVSPEVLSGILLCAQG